MDEKNKRMQLERANHKKLSDEVQILVVSVVLVLILSSAYSNEN